MNFLQSLAKQFAGKPIDWDELEEGLIRADLGVPMTTRIIKTAPQETARRLGFARNWRRHQKRRAKRLRAFYRAIRRQSVEQTANQR